MSDTTFARPTSIGEGGRVQFGSDDRLWVKFTQKSVRNAHRSDQEGRPVYEPVDYIQIQQPGERDMLVRPVRDDDKMRWPKLWEAYQAQAEQSPDGTPVEMLFPNEKHVVEMLRDLHIMTVEQLAQVSEHAIRRMGMDGRKYVAKAQAALDQTAAAKEVGRLTRALEEEKERSMLLDDNMKLLQGRFDALERRLHQRLDEELDDPQPRRRGRPPKEHSPAMDELPVERSDLVG